MFNTLIDELMSRGVHAIDPDLGVDEAVKLMGEHRVRRLPVITKRGRLAGIITLAEAREAKLRAEIPRFSQEDASATMPLVRDVMTDYVYTAAPEDTVGKAAQLMVQQRISALPVVADGQVVGMITESDLFRFMASQSEPLPA